VQRAKQMVAHSTIYAVGNISRQIVGFLMLPIYTTYLSPADYGVIGLLVFLVSLFELLLGGHMFSAVPKFYNQEDDIGKRNSVIVTALGVTAVFSGLACLLMVGLSEQLSRLMFGSMDYSLYVSIFAVLILTHALEQYGLTYIRLIRKPWTFFSLNIFKLILQLVLNVVTIVVMDLGLLGLAASSLISSVVFACVLLVYTLRKTGLSINWGVVRPMLEFSWPLWVSGLLGLYIGSSNRYFIRIFSSLDDVGLYELAAKFGMIISLLVWTPFSQYWQTERFAVARYDDPYPVYSAAFRMIAALLFIAGVVVSQYAELAIVIMSATAFHDAASAVPFLVVAGLFQSLTVFCNFSFMLTGSTKMIYRINFMTAVVVTVLYWAMVPWFGFVGAAAAFALAAILQYCFTLVIGKRSYDLRLKQMPLVVSVCALSLGSLATTLIDVDAGLLFNVLMRGIISVAVICVVIVAMVNAHELQWLRGKIQSVLPR
jgi:O-antigen/teichoic acid export membrane protein